MTTAGEAISTLSIRSNMPPCPGSIFPESLTFKVRFIIDSQRSPHVENTEIRMPNAIHCHRLRENDRVEYCSNGR